MRRFSADYLRRTRDGMWDGARGALDPLDLSDRERVLDVGCGLATLTRALAEESGATAIGLDADRDLLASVDAVPTVEGDARRLPFADGSFDLVTCQALLINLPDPAAAVREFARASSELVAAVEPDNADVTVESTVEAETRLARRARAAYMADLDTDVALGPVVADVFRGVDLERVEVRRHDVTRTVAPPYSDRALAAARRKVWAVGLDDARDTMLDGGLTAEGYDALKGDWRTMGRTVVDQMRAGDYRRTETVPFYVTVGRV